MPLAKTRFALPLAAALAPALLLAACGHGGKGGDAASAENVEMPAEEAMRGLDANATPVPDAEATAAVADTSEPAAAPSAATAAKATSSASPASAASPIRM
jgi:hypothetical protein